MVKKYFLSFSHFFFSSGFCLTRSGPKNQTVTSTLCETSLYLKIIIVWLAFFPWKKNLYLLFKNFLSYLWILSDVSLTFLPIPFFFSTQLFQIMFSIKFFFHAIYFTFRCCTHSEQPFQTLQILRVLRSKESCILLLCFHWIDFFILFFR